MRNAEQPAEHAEDHIDDDADDHADGEARSPSPSPNRSAISRASGGKSGLLARMRSRNLSLHRPHHDLHRNREDRRDHAADQAGHKPDQRAFGRRDLQRRVLLAQIDGQHAAAHDPQAAAAVAGADERQRRQHADEQPAPERRLQPVFMLILVVDQLPPVSQYSRPRCVMSSSPRRNRSVFFSFIS